MDIVVHDRIQRDMAVHANHRAGDYGKPVDSLIDTFLRVYPGNDSGD